MEEKIPFDKISDFYIKYKNFSIGTEPDMKEYNEELDKQFKIMEQITLEDVENLTKDELKRIPIGWLFDWNKVTGGYEDHTKILKLYQKHNIDTSVNKYSSRIQYEKVHKILPHAELKYYIQEFLVSSRSFIRDVDNCMHELSGENKLINKTIEERMTYFNSIIGNEARTYILKVLTLKYLSQILLFNIENFTDGFWRDRLNNVLKK